jgi:hypothetical protein
MTSLSSLVQFHKNSAYLTEHNQETPTTELEKDGSRHHHSPLKMQREDGEIV